MREISFEISKTDLAIVEQIANRALSLVDPATNVRTKRDFMMDITACHANGNPLKLQALLEADNFNFAHDVFGIERHLNRYTGQLNNLFSPRYSK